MISDTVKLTAACCDVRLVCSCCFISTDSRRCPVTADWNKKRKRNEDNTGVLGLNGQCILSGRLSVPQVSALAARHILADNALTFFSLLAVNVSSWTSSASLSGPLIRCSLSFFFFLFSLPFMLLVQTRLSNITNTKGDRNVNKQTGSVCLRSRRLIATSLVRPSER